MTQIEFAALLGIRATSWNHILGGARGLGRDNAEKVASIIKKTDAFLWVGCDKPGSTTLRDKRRAAWEKYRASARG